MGRKLIAVILVGVLLASCFACGKRKRQEDRTEEVQEEAKEEAQEEVEEEAQEEVKEEVKEEEVSLPEKRQLEGRIVDCTSLLQKELDPMFLPEEYLGIPGREFTIASMTVSLWSVGYKTLAQQLPPAMALIVRTHRPADADGFRTFVIPGPPDVIIDTGSSEESALALWWGFGGGSGWTRRSGGRVKYKLEPSYDFIELFYLIPRFSGKATVKLGNVGSFTVRSDAEM